MVRLHVTIIAKSFITAYDITKTFSRKMDDHRERYECVITELNMCHSAAYTTAWLNSVF